MSEPSVVASLSALDASAQEVLRARLESLEGVQRVLLETSRGEVWLVGGPEAGRAGVEAGAREVLEQAGVDPGGVSLLVLRPSADAERQRARFIAIERSVTNDGHIRLRVTLEWQDRHYVGEEVTEPGVPMETSAAAAATVQAVMRAADGELNLRLTGIKPVRAFDHEIMVASVYRVGAARKQLIGAVLMGDDHLRTACVAVLSGLNRVFGNFLNTAY